MNQADPTPNDASILESNRRAWDRMVEERRPLCQPASDAELADPLGHVDPLGWLGGNIRNWRVLCLAAGGGRHSALYATAGADVTVVDISPAMLELDRAVARERSLSIRSIRASMDELPMLREAEFDLVIHPVSTCYVRSVAPVFAEVARVVRPGGLYVSQHKQPISLQSSIDPHPAGGYQVRHTYYRDAPVPPPSETSSSAARLRESGATEFLHRWEQIVGGICRAGFVIEDLVEPVHAREDADRGTFADRARYIAPYMRIKARRRGTSPSLWLP